MLSVLLRRGIELQITGEFERIYKELHKACREGDKERITMIVTELLGKLDNVIILGKPEAIMYKCDSISDSTLEILLMFAQFMILILFLPDKAKMVILIRPPIAFEIHTTFPI